MIYRLYVITVLFVFSTFNCFSDFQAEKVYSECANGVVLVETSFSFGAGALINNDGWILTNTHIVDSVLINDIRVILKNGKIIQSN